MKSKLKNLAILALVLKAAYLVVIELAGLEMPGAS